MRIRRKEVGMNASNGYMDICVSGGGGGGGGGYRVYEWTGEYILCVTDA